MLLNYAILVIIPLIFTLIIVLFEGWWYMRVDDFLLIYSVTNFSLLPTSLLIHNYFIAIFLWLLFKYIILEFYNYILKNRRKTIITISIVLWLLLSLMWYFTIWLWMSV
jgi:hypothetical protein